MVHNDGLNTTIVFDELPDFDVLIEAAIGGEIIKTLFKWSSHNFFNLMKKHAEIITLR